MYSEYLRQLLYIDIFLRFAIDYYNDTMRLAVCVLLVLCV